jgi:hypothetical protein
LDRETELLVERVMTRMTAMTNRTLAMLALTVGADLGAQSRSSLGVTFAAEHDAQRNPGASPYAYSGSGMGGELRYTRWNAGTAFDVRLGASSATLRSAITGGGKPIEELTSATISAGYARPVGDTTARLQWQIGARLSARFTATRHLYASPFTYSDDFGFYGIGVGPELHASIPVRRSRLTNRLSVPLVTLIDYPYSNLKASKGDLSFAFPPKAVLLENELSYRVGSIRKRGIAWRYQLSFLRYDLGDPRLFAQQLVGLEVHWILGGPGQ